MPLVSIIIPTYNCGRHIVHCVNSLLHQQTQLTYEIIIVDDASTDKTLEILRELSSDPKVRVIPSSERKGSYVRRNLGARNARGEILVFTEPDCIPPPYWLEKIVSPVISENAKAVKGIIKSTGSGVWVEVERIRLSHYPGPTVKNFAIKKEVFNRVGGFDESFIWSDDASPGDMDMDRRMEAAGINIRHENGAYVYHYWRNNPFVFLKRRVWHSLERLKLLFKYKPDSFKRMREGTLISRIVRLILISGRYSFHLSKEDTKLTRYIKGAFFFYHFFTYTFTEIVMTLHVRKKALRERHHKSLLLNQPL